MLYTLLVFLLFKIEFLQSETNACPHILIISSRFECKCSINEWNFDATEYHIACDKSSSQGANSTSLIQVHRLDQSQINPEFIQTFSLVDQVMNELNDSLIETPLELLELELSNDSIRSVSQSALFNLKKLNMLKITGNPMETFNLSIVNNLKYLEQLNLAGNRLKSVVRNYGKSSSLKILNLHENLLVNLSNFGKFPYLESLTLGQNLIEVINNKTFLDMSKLRFLSLSWNRIVAIEPNAFANIQNLVDLDLSHNELKSIDASLLAGLSSLTSVSLDGNHLVDIMSNSFVSLNIGKLDLSQQSIKLIEPSAIAKCDSLYRLSLAFNQLETLSAASFSDLPRLSEIDLRSNRLKQLRIDWFVRVNLERVYLTRNYINTIIQEPKSPDESSISFTHLYLDDNFLGHLTSDMFTRFDRLEKLDLGSNLISSIEAGTFTRLAALVSLTLSTNSLRELDAETFTGLEQLESISLGGNKLTNINANVFSTTNLSRLNLLNMDYNFITTIEAFSFAQLQNLNTLSLNANRLVEITANMFSGLARLEYLSLNSNKIASIANGAFADTTSLQRLYLDSNELKSLAPGLLNGLDSLEYISLAFNQLETIDNLFDDENSTTSLQQSSLSLYLASNRLRRIDNRTFAGIQQLDTLDLSANPLDVHIDKSAFDRFVHTIEHFYLREFDGNPADFLELSAYDRLNTLDVSKTRFRVGQATFANTQLVNSFKSLKLRQVDLRRLAEFPMIEMTSLRLLDLSDNPLDWPSQCASSSNKQTAYRFFNTHPYLTEVYLSNTSLVDLKCLGLSGLDNLIALDVSHNLIETIEADIFRFDCSVPLNEQGCFKGLNLTNNRIKTIEPTAFNFISSLEDLQLNDNLLQDKTQLASIRFSSLFLLVNLEISNSELTQLPLFSAHQASHTIELTSLKVVGNRLESISSVYFDDLRLLARLNLSNNVIARVESPDLFKSLTLLDQLDLSSNLIDSQALARINVNLCTGLSYLNLSDNRLSVLGSFLFSNLRKLKVIDVSHNRIVEIDENAFVGLTILNKLYMYNLNPSSSSVILRESFTRDYELLKFVYVSSIELIESNMRAVVGSLRAELTNKVVNHAAYFKSINILVDNYDYYESDTKLACLFTIRLLSHRIHVNLFDEVGFNVFLSHCQSLDLTAD